MVNNRCIRRSHLLHLILRVDICWNTHTQTNKNKTKKPHHSHLRYLDKREGKGPIKTLMEGGEEGRNTRKELMLNEKAQKKKMEVTGDWLYLLYNFVRSHLSLLIFIANLTGLSITPEIPVWVCPWGQLQGDSTYPRKSQPGWQQDLARGGAWTEKKRKVSWAPASMPLLPDHTWWPVTSHSHHFAFLTMVTVPSAQEPKQPFFSPKLFRTFDHSHILMHQEKRLGVHGLKNILEGDYPGSLRSLL